MERKPLIEVSICAVVLLILGSLSNVVGYQTVHTTQQSVINERINQRELLFQTIVDMVNDKEIQRIILKSQMSRGIFPEVDIPVLTKNQLKQISFLGLILSKVISKSKIVSMIGKHHFSNQEMQQGITAAIEKNPSLKREITQLSNSDCECENENTTILYFPVYCIILLCIFGLSLFLFYTFHLGAIILIIADFLITLFQCLGYP